MDQDSNPEPRKRLRTILSSQDDEADAQPLPQDQPRSRSPLLQLPQRKSFAPQTSSPASETVAPQESVQTQDLAQPTPSSAEESAVTQDSTQMPPPAPPPASPFAGLNFGPAFWTVTGILSLVVNGILIAVMLVLFYRLDQLQSLQGSVTEIGTSVLGGMYSNFEKMDRATIKTVIPVDAQVPLNLTVPVRTTTQIILAESVAIPNTYVEIKSSTFTLNSAARVTLPAGTPLMVELNFDLPVEATIPVHLEVPVNIPMADTELHEPFVGLQRVVQPWYCMVEPNAFSLTGQPICR